MALCRRRSLATKVMVGVLVVWAVLLLLFLVDRRDAKPESDPGRDQPLVDVFRRAHRRIDSIVNEGLERPMRLGNVDAVAATTAPRTARVPEIRGDQRGYLLPPQEPNGPGEMGKPVRLPTNLTTEQQKLVKLGWSNNAFNQYVSDMISPHRRLPDIRDDKCRDRRQWDRRLPDTSVIVCFHNEAWSTLIRTVHSILDRSPEHLLKEVILVDDFSDMAHVGAQLDQYMAQYPRVKIVRTSKREGLIRARLVGARHATGAVLTYLDSHCECTDGWLEPLLDRIALNRTTVVCPVIDVIDDTTLELHFQKASGTSVGGFDWNLQFSWHGIPEREKRLHSHSSEPLASPTMAGGLFAIDRSWFEELGTYDQGFDIWGSENLEISFKTWMCGGRLEIVPCSHVGHIFRKRSPYTWRSGVNVLRRNSVRLAEVWMDDYKKYFYQRINNDLGDFGDVSSRKAIRRRLQCKSFEWYLNTVYPELFIPGDAVASGEVRCLSDGGDMCLDSPARRSDLQRPVGLYPCHGRGGNQVRNVATDICLDSENGPDDLYKNVGTFPCHKQGGNQFWMLSKGGEIRRDEVCLDFAGSGVVLYPCHGTKGNQWWIYDPKTGQLLHSITKLCLGITTDKELTMHGCSFADASQRWLFQNYDPSKLA